MFIDNLKSSRLHVIRYIILSKAVSYIFSPNNVYFCISKDCSLIDQRIVIIPIPMVDNFIGAENVQTLPSNKRNCMIKTHVSKAKYFQNISYDT